MNIKIYDEFDKPCNRNTIQYDKSLATLTTSSPLSLIESKLVFKVIAQINYKDEDFKNYKINASELSSEIYNELKIEARKKSKLKNKIITPLEIAKNKSKQLEIFCKNMMSKSLNLPVENSLDFDIVSWFANFNYKSDEDIIYCNFHPKLKPFLIEFKNNHFKKIFASNVLRFKSKYTHKIYMLLKTVQHNKGYVFVDEYKNELPLQYIRNLLGIENDEYKLYADLKRFVLSKVIEDLKEIAEVYFEFEEIKKGKKVEKLKLKVIYNKDKNLTKEQDETPTRSDYDDEEKKDTDLENQNLEYFFDTHRIIRHENENYKLIEFYTDSYRSNKLSIKLENIKDNSIKLLEFNYKSKNKLLKEFVFPRHLEYISFYEENYAENSLF